MLMGKRELFKSEIEEHLKGLKGFLGEEEIKEIVNKTIKAAEEEELTEPEIIFKSTEFEEDLIYNPFFLEHFVLPEKLNKIRDSIMPNYGETFKVFKPLRNFIFNLDKVREWLVKNRSNENFTWKDMDRIRKILGDHYSRFEKEVEKYSKNYPEIVETIKSIVDAFYEYINNNVNIAIHYSYDPSVFYKETDNLIELLRFVSHVYFDMYNDAFVTSYEAIKERSKEKLGEVV